MVNGLLLSQFSAAISGAGVPVDIAALHPGQNAETVNATRKQSLVSRNIFFCSITSRTFYLDDSLFAGVA
jgi:hypothetical protein